MVGAVLVRAVRPGAEAEGPEQRALVAAQPGAIILAAAAVLLPAYLGI